MSAHTRAIAEAFSGQRFAESYQYLAPGNAIRILQPKQAAEEATPDGTSRA